jgi:hypothetical protein
MRCGFIEPPGKRWTYERNPTKIKLFKRQFAHWFEILNKAGWRVCHNYLEAPTKWNYEPDGTDFFLCPSCAAKYIPTEIINSLSKRDILLEESKKEVTP